VIQVVLVIGERMVDGESVLLTRRKRGGYWLVVDGEVSARLFPPVDGTWLCRNPVCSTQPRAFTAPTTPEQARHGTPFPVN
jgi:hypothetical protein